MSKTKRMKTLRYRLYGALPCPATLAIAMETPYARIGNGYILLYKRGVAPEGFIELTKNIVEGLTADEKEWLREVNYAIMAEFIAKHEAAQKRGIIAFAKRFEKELQAETDKRMEALDNERAGD